jgi:hypothetical protein
MSLVDSLLPLAIMHCANRLGRRVTAQARSAAWATIVEVRALSTAPVTAARLASQKSAELAFHGLRKEFRHIAAPAERTL